MFRGRPIQHAVSLRTKFSEVEYSAGGFRCYLNMDVPDSLTLEKLPTLKVVDLRQELEKRGLEKSGLKADLVKRLEKVSN